MAPPVTLLDSCVVLDIATDDPHWAAWSGGAVTRALDAGTVVINPIVYAEVSIGFDAVEELDRVLPPADYEREVLPYEAAFLAGKAFMAYRRRGGQKRSPLPDFYIGAHAAVRSYRLLTRDAARYRTYFPHLELITPDAA
jgi:hypothetical protein